MTGLEELFLKWRDGSLSAAELQEFNRLLAQPEARARLVKEFAFDEMLCETLRAEQAQRAVQQQAHAYETLGLDEDDAAARPDETPVQPAGRSRTLRWRVALPLAACLLALAVAVPLFSERDALGQLEQTSVRVTIKRGESSIVAPPVGFRLHSGDELILATNATVTIAYAGDSTRLRAHPGSRLVLEATDEGRRVDLFAGKVTASVAPQPKENPMQFFTPHAVAMVPGTELSLSVSSNASRLEVLEGSVRLLRREDEKSIVVPAGFYSLANNSVELTMRPLLPEPWHSQDIGKTGKPGHAQWDGKKCRVFGGGFDPRRGRDGFHFVYQTLEGNGEIRARVLEFDPNDKRAKAGVVIRESLKSMAPTAFLRVNAGRGLEFVKRRQRDESKTEVAGAETFPYWVRLVRNDDTITAFKSADGENWSETGSGKFEMGRRIYIGLGVISFEKPGFNAVVFDNVSVVAAAGPAASR